MVEQPELIEIIEGPTPEFHASPQIWLQSFQEGPSAQEIALCQLRTATGRDIKARCESAWREGRAVRLDFPDELRMRQQVNVIALRLSEIDEGELLTIWVSLPFEFESIQDFEDDDEDDDLADDDDMLYLG